jgi:hypothetical protein
MSKGQEASRQAVRSYLSDRLNEWIPGYELTAPDVGGSEGLRRLRELRADGLPIEGRKKAKSTAWEYRLLEVAPSRTPW